MGAIICPDAHEIPSPSAGQGGLGTAIQAEDLDVFPIWEFCLDEEGVEEMDETWVRPTKAVEIPKGVYALTVAAHIIAANGMKFKGFVAVDTADAFEVSGFGVPFPQYCFVPAVASGADKATFGATVGVAPDLAFPVRYQVCVPFAGEPLLRQGQIG